MREISQELQDTVRKNPNIKEVHFDKNNNHYFHAFKLKTNKDSKEEKFFGDGTFSHKQIIPGPLNVDNITEDIPKGVAGTEIIETISREDILNFTPKRSGKDLVSQVVNASDEEKATIAAALLPAGLLEKLNQLEKSKQESTSDTAPTQDTPPIIKPGKK